MRLLLVFLILGAISCDSAKKKKQDNILDVVLTAKLSGLDPAISYDTVSAQVVYQVHETLYEYDYLIRPYSIKPLLAKELPKITDDGLTYTIQIKKNVQYHPHPALKETRILKAQDFVNQIKRIAYKKTQSPGWWLFADKIKGLNDFRSKVDNLREFESTKVEGLKALNDNTLQIKLETKYPQLLYALAMSFTAPTPLELIKHFENDLSQIPIGTGPFLFLNWEKNLEVNLAANPNYHSNTFPKSGDRFSYENNLLKDAGKKIPFLDGIRFHVINEARPRMQNFLKGNLDFIVLTKDYLQMALNYKGALKKELKEKGVSLQVAPTLTYWWLAFNMKDSIVGKNLNLRKAIAHAIDNERFIKIFTNNTGLKANSIFPPGIPGYSPSSELPYSYDLDKAKSFLSKAGFPNGKGLSALSYDVRGASSTSRQMAEFIKSELEKIGIKIKININTFPAFLKKAQNGQLQFWQGGWTMDYPDPENIGQLLISGNHPPGPNTSYYSNPKVDKLYQSLSKLKREANPGPIMMKIEKQINSDLPWIMQYYARSYVLSHKRVKNFRYSDIVFNMYKYLRLD
ncbi:MAG: hypothetical protein CME64_15475 [Halobacteriovoraceae bacterium]|nr:hypothetical protein [Halobacteriovoraceae bacterium]|tara:strand:- start:142182 stop:143894 length:1713 start_codon:yes stop_codon:yes gene_type:complete